MKTAILVISFGSSHLDALRSGIESIERDIARAFPACDVFRAFTSGMIIRKLKRERDLAIDAPEEAIRRIADAGYDRLVLVPTHVIAGFEYEKVNRLCDQWRDAAVFSSISITTPLLYDDADYAALARIMEAQAESAAGTVLWMGHGSEHAANASYAKLQARLPAHVQIGCVEGSPELADLLPALRAGETRTVTLMPLMIVAGDHAKNDMAGDEDDSWKCILEKEGFQVDVRLKGLGEYTEVRALFVDRVERALRREL
ncbi:MAG: sirohydrochlorin cobaltochelatase [Christensenellales bacterium]|jgi:sirohydrochlorin cobaltochelatase